MSHDYYSSAQASSGGGGGTPDDNSVSTAKIQDAAVTTAKLADASVTLAKLATEVTDEIAAAGGTPDDGSVSTAKIVDLAVTTAKINAAAVTLAKLATEVTDILDVIPGNILSTVSVEGTTDPNSRGVLGLLAGDGVALAQADDSGNNRVNVTIAREDFQRATVATTNATPTNIGSAISVAASEVVELMISVKGRLTTHDGSIVCYDRQLTIENTGGTLTIRRNSTPVADFEATTPTNLSAANFPAPTLNNGTPGNVQVQVTGIAATNMTWTAEIYVRR